MMTIMEVLKNSQLIEITVEFVEKKITFSTLHKLVQQSFISELGQFMFIWCTLSSRSCIPKIIKIS